MEYVISVFFINKYISHVNTHFKIPSPLISFS